MTLRQKTISGIFWTLFQQFSVQIINFGVQIILARLLLPQAFGIIAMLQIFMAIGQSLTDSGMTSSLIRTSNPDQSDYSAVFFINLSFSIIVYTLLFFVSPFISLFFKISTLSIIVRVYAISFIIQALVGVQTTRLTKMMNFKLQMFMQVPSVIIGGLAGIILARLHYGVWSLVWMNLIRTFIFMIQHWFYTDWRPSFVFDIEKIRYHLKFGYKLTLSGLLDIIYNNSYNIIIGKMFSVTILGYYNEADTLRMFPVNNVSLALNKVTYSLFASIQEDNIRLKSAYKKIMQQVFFWIIPLMLLLIIISRKVFILLLGAKWLPAVPYFQILCIAAIAYPFHVYNLNIINVKGRSDLFLKLEIIKKIISTIIIIISIFWGIWGLIFGQIFISYICVVVNSFYSGRIIGYNLKEQLNDVYPIFIVGILSALLTWIGAVYMEKYMIDNATYIIISFILYYLIYFLISFLLKISALKVITQLIYPYLNLKILQK